MGNKVEALEKEIQDLTRDELASFRSWFLKFDAAAWDCEMEMNIEAASLTSWQRRHWLRINVGRVENFEALCHTGFLDTF